MISFSILWWSFLEICFCSPCKLFKAATVYWQNSQKIDRLDGAHAPELTKKVQRHASSLTLSSASADNEKEDLNSRLKKLINAAPCMLFMKGTSHEPRCGKNYLKCLCSGPIYYTICVVSFFFKKYDLYSRVINPLFSNTTSSLI